MRSPDGWGAKPKRWRDRWRSYLTLGYDELGKPKRKWVYGKTEAECLVKLDGLRRELEAGHVPTDGSLTLNQYITEWLEGMSRQVKIGTLKQYKSNLKRIQKLSGRTKLVDAQPLLLQRWFDRISDEVSPSSANQSRQVLSHCLKDAVRYGLLNRNPIDATRPRRVEREEMSVWTAEQVQTFLQVATGSPYYALYYLALVTGLRPGELLALQWADLTPEGIHVRRTVDDPAKRSDGPPKSRSGRRTVPVPTDARQVLEGHRANLTLDGIGDGPMFPTFRGRRSHHSNVQNSLRVWAGKAGVPGIRVHDLRHTYASMAIAGGMDVAELAKRLGHSNPSITLRVYVHFFEQRVKRPALTLGDLLGNSDPVGGNPVGNLPTPLN